MRDRSWRLSTDYWLLPKGRSLIGRAAVSKAAGWGFDSLRPCLSGLTVSSMGQPQGQEGGDGGNRRGLRSGGGPGLAPAPFFRTGQAMAVAVKNSPEVASPGLLDRMAVASLAGTVY